MIDKQTPSVETSRIQIGRFDVFFSEMEISHSGI